MGYDFLKNLPIFVGKNKNILKVIKKFNLFKFFYSNVFFFSINNFFFWNFLTLFGLMKFLKKTTRKNAVVASKMFFFFFKREIKELSSFTLLPSEVLKSFGGFLTNFQSTRWLIFNTKRKLFCELPLFIFFLEQDNLRNATLECLFLKIISYSFFSFSKKLNNFINFFFLPTTKDSAIQLTALKQNLKLILYCLTSIDKCKK